MNNKIKIVATAATASLLLAGCGSDLQGSSLVTYTEEDVQEAQVNTEEKIMLGEVPLESQRTKETDDFVNVDPISPEKTADTESIEE